MFRIDRSAVLPFVVTLIASLGSSWWSVPESARADEAPPMIAWSVPAACGDPASFSSDLERLAGDDHPMAQLVALSVDIRPVTEAELELVLRFQALHGNAQTRTLRDASCRALVRAAAVTVSLALRAAAETVADAPAQRTEPPPSEALPIAVPQGSDAETIPALEKTKPNRGARHYQLWFSAAPTWLARVLPTQSFGAGLSLGARVRSLRADAGGSYIWPREGPTEPALQLRANLTAAHAALGIEAWSWARGALVVQAHTTFGVMGAAGRGVQQATTARALFGAVGGGLLGEALLRPGLSLGLLAALQYAVVRARFELANGETLYRTPPWSTLVQATLSVRFL